MNIHRLFFVAKYEHIILQKQTKKVENFCNDFSVFFYILVIRAKALTEQDGKEVGEEKVWKDETSSSPYTWTSGLQSPDVAVSSTRRFSVMQRSTVSPTYLGAISKKR